MKLDLFCGIIIIFVFQYSSSFQGCIKKVSDLSKAHLNAIIVSVFLFALVQMICLVFAVCVLLAIKRGDDE
ncbi:putative tetraspanin [Schistosoma mansoni]|uniref:putative tetraspanin n=1 Tax=Schistosoma mansoni TaxID=6183 RepID=UPI00022DBE8B|nr:putative tetraspanin [Schistosoma mansoni]|eukprot:XP_018652305.1 putative tetraspanin [Schistosoma mansoni]